MMSCSRSAVVVVVVWFVIGILGGTEHCLRNRVSLRIMSRVLDLRGS